MDGQRHVDRLWAPITRVGQRQLPRVRELPETWGIYLRRRSVQDADDPAEHGVRRTGAHRASRTGRTDCGRVRVHKREPTVRRVAWHDHRQHVRLPGVLHQQSAIKRMQAANEQLENDQPAPSRNHNYQRENEVRGEDNIPGRRLARRRHGKAGPEYA